MLHGDGVVGNEKEVAVLLITTQQHIK